MSEIDGTYGTYYEKIAIRKVRLSRIDSRWLVEYKRAARAWAPWDYFWWYNEGQYVEYADANARVDKLIARGLLIHRYRKAQVFDVDV